MNSISKSFSYLKNYRLLVIINFFITVIVALLDVFSFLSIIPLLKLLFSKGETFKELPEPDSISYTSISDFIASLEAKFSYTMNQFVIENGKEEILLWVCIGLFFIFLLKNIFAYFEKLLEKYIRLNVARDVRKSLYEKVLQLPITYFNTEKRGDILTRYSSDLNGVKGLSMGGYLIVIKHPIKIIGYILAMVAISKELTVFAFILIPILGLVISRISKTLKKRTHILQEKSAQLFARLDETIFGAKIIKSFTAERFLEDAFNKGNEDFTRSSKSIERRQVAASPISEVLGIGLVLIVMWYGGNLILSETSNLTADLFLTFIVIFSQTITPIKAFAKEYSALIRGVASAERIETFLSYESEFDNSSTEPIEFNREIEFRNVDFEYSENGKLIINNFSLILKKGTTTALVGQSGAGKSTIADLLPRFYDVTRGEILLDGTPIKNYSKNQLRSLLSYVSQESILFNDTIYNNIAFGSGNETEESIIEAAKAANAHDFIMNLEHGYHTNVGERGGKLSGGQKQRITIARAILKNSPILILDEATSALDTESERLVQDAIDKLLENRTALVIAHRLSTIKNADQICVMQDGRIIEQGNHEDLIEQNGHYKTLTQMQTV